MEHEELILDTVGSLKEFLPKIASACLSIAEELRDNNESEAMKQINQFTDAVDWSIQAINGIKSLNYPLDINTTGINEFLIEAQEGLEANDLVIVADMFEYEILPQIENWLQEVQAITH
ncbi:hypothetical protein [Domibacillus iocasae]|uniref:DUF8042 domain-containing protein n=1 Tax=Domibacillus iocasae TaxID=1714016 RepID=A0A1E7DSK2_9BACI|nr:hypothetical protein [Domibacillus iocasae]OES46056.1 hypothetical protein BA724_15825 [Domibacillus iocasae]